MKLYLALAFVLLASTSIATQTIADTEAEQVQTAARKLVGKKVTVDVLLRDLNEMSGYVVRIDKDLFEMNTHRKKRTGVKVHYSDVLVLSSKKVSVSFIPHPKTTPYGEWADLKKIRPFIILEVTHKNGEVKTGHYRSSEADSLVLVPTDKFEEWTIQRADIAFVHRVKPGWRDISGSSSKGTYVGADIGRGPGSSGSAVSSLFGAAVGAGIGAIKGALTKHEAGLKVLIFSQ